MLRIATVNVNGIRAAWRKGMGPWIEEADADVVTLQEVRAANDIALTMFGDIEGYAAYSADSTEAKGRAGVAVLARGASGAGAAGAGEGAVPAGAQAVATRVGIGDEYFDAAGRWIETDFELADGSLLTVVSAYVHSGDMKRASDPISEKQADKYRFLDRMVERLPEIRAHADHAVVTGDMNVCHTERDIKNAKSNKWSSGFLIPEREYFDRFFGELGWVDVHRQLNGDVDGPYTWWSMRGKAFDTDAGWRIDYQMATPELAAAAKASRVDRAPDYASRWSDHAPLVIDYDVPGLK
ncbi:exodeoxyribonuclease III [Brevibacterium litoralis]|uniref:exodeoxyribonuclease III n=1 Tax=Brevibacterium litoralis TaxID=3138935 RepID=UPI0032EB13C5